MANAILFNILACAERIQNPVKHLKRSFMQKLREIFSKMKILSCNIYIPKIFEIARWEYRIFSLSKSVVSKLFTYIIACH